jgi:hypothetical protein
MHMTGVMTSGAKWSRNDLVWLFSVASAEDAVPDPASGPWSKSVT